MSFWIFFTTKSIIKTCFIILKGHIKGGEFGKIVCEKNINVWKIILEDDNFELT
jgi:hypothetical protein